MDGRRDGRPAFPYPPLRFVGAGDNYIYFTVTATIDNYKRIKDTKRKTKRNSFMMFPVCLITKTMISTHIANNLPDGKLRLRFNFCGTFFLLIPGNGNWELRSLDTSLADMYRP